MHMLTLKPWGLSCTPSSTLVHPLSGSCQRYFSCPVFLSLAFLSHPKNLPRPYGSLPFFPRQLLIWAVCTPSFAPPTMPHVAESCLSQLSTLAFFSLCSTRHCTS
nr:hypothetical protein DKFZp547C092.1 - human [Homo sapiens]